MVAVLAQRTGEGHHKLLQARGETQLLSETGALADAHANAATPFATPTRPWTNGTRGQPVSIVLLACGEVVDPAVAGVSGPAGDNVGVQAEKVGDNDGWQVGDCLNYRGVAGGAGG